MGFWTVLTNYLTYIISGAVAVTVITGVSSDLSFYSDSFMKDDEIQVIKRLEGNSNRYVASSLDNNLKPDYLPLDERGLNAGKINGIWEIYSYRNEIDETTKKSVKVIFELVGTSYIKISQIEGSEDSDLFQGGDFINYYMYSLFNDENFIKLFQMVGDSNRMIDAKRVSDKNILVTQKVVRREAVQGRDWYSEKSRTAENVYEQNVDYPPAKSFDIVSIFDPARVKDFIKGDFVKGDINVQIKQITRPDGSITDIVESIESLNIDIKYGEDICYGEISMYQVVVRDGGQFSIKLSDCMKGGEQVDAMGVITRSGENAYSIMFATGPYASARINFSSEETDQEDVYKEIKKEENEDKDESYVDYSQSESKEGDEGTAEPVEGADWDNDEVAESDDEQNEEYEDGDTPKVKTAKMVGRQNRAASERRIEGDMY